MTPRRDSVGGIEAAEPPAIVSICDIHGHIQAARSALLTLTEHPDYDPIVETDAARRLQWAGGDEYVLVFNGDLIDRGAHSERVVEMARRLGSQAPPGHVRVTVGNHELGVLTPDTYGWEGWYSAERTDDERTQFLETVRDGHVVAAYEGYEFVYAHAGRTEPYDVVSVNDQLADAADELYGAVGTPDDAGVQTTVTDAYPDVFSFDGHTGRGPGAGIAWLDFEYMPEDAPRQVVGHTVHRYPVREGTVICGNVIRKNRRRDGGEAVLVETPGGIAALGRNADGEVMEHEFDVPDTTVG